MDLSEIEKYNLANVMIAAVDDHEVVLEGIQSALTKNGATQVETFLSATALLARMAAKHFDVYIVDVELPDAEVWNLIDQMRVLHPEARIIINTIHEEVWITNHLAEKKVEGVIYKSDQMSQLIDAIAAVMRGQKYYCRKFQKSCEQLTLNNTVLSDRELDVLLGIAHGMSTKEMVNTLYISENTIETHRKSLFRKLHARNAADLVMKAIAAGYIAPDTIRK